MKRLRFVSGEVDRTDGRIIDALGKNARVTIAELARTLNFSAPAIAERIKRLEEAGVIEAFTIAVDYETLGLPIAAWLRIRPIPGELRRVADIVKSLPEVVQCDRITGDDCFIARVHVETQSDLEELIDKLIPYSMTNTAIVQSSVVKPRLLPFVPK